MKIKTRGIVFALKNIGSWLASYTVSGIKSDPAQFLYALLIYVLINTPTDLFLLNHWSHEDKKGK